MNSSNVIALQLALSEMKSKLLSVALSLEEDKVYSKETAVEDLLEVIEQIGLIEVQKLK
ncbi:hypothetical protein [Rossellomorea arthrocnemi]|jgi:hypothetical protein|uniref:hypothetical protein n=1 Tax=Rossellomorea arthrocnemi TaxID=2769542 RepID=UPI00191A8844|nr:hypothetical protein [Rossellomorea arthrocnemi]